MTSDDVLQLCLQALRGTPDQPGTGAGQNVFSPRTIPTWDGDYPMLIVECNEESGTSLGNSGPSQFNVVATIRILGRVQADSLADDAASAIVSMALDTLRDQIKRAVINNPLLWRAGVQEFVSFSCSKRFGDETAAKNNGEIDVQIGIQFYQGVDDFWQLEAVPLDEVSLQIKEPGGTPIPGADITYLQEV